MSEDSFKCCGDPGDCASTNCEYNRNTITLAGVISFNQKGDEVLIFEPGFVRPPTPGKPCVGATFDESDGC
jgi:hypothetical protein